MTEDTSSYIFHSTIHYDVTDLKSKIFDVEIFSSTSFDKAQSKEDLSKSLGPPSAL